MIERASNIKIAYWITQNIMEGHELTIEDVMRHSNFKYAQARVYLKKAEDRLPVSTKRDGRTKVWFISDSDLYSLTDKRRRNEQNKRTA